MQKNGKKMDVKKLMGKARTAQTQLKALLQDGNWMDEARKYVERQGKEMQKLIHGDLEKVREFVERERRELGRIQKQIPMEVTRWKKYLTSQRKELEKVLAGVRGASKKPTRKSKGGAKKRSTKKAAARKAPSATASV